MWLMFHFKKNVEEYGGIVKNDPSGPEGMRKTKKLRETNVCHIL